MNKAKGILMVIGGVVFLYLVLLIVVPFLADIATAANTTMHASSNLSDYPGGEEILFAAPWLLFFVPGGIGIAAIIFILRQP